MELTKMFLSFGTGVAKNVAVPLNCPYCGKAVEFNPVTHHFFDFLNNEEIHIYTVSSKCCNKYSLITYHKKFDTELENYVYEFISMYPNPKSLYLPDGIQEISPRFCDLINDCEFAFSKNMFELAGTGYRNALEILVKDYAIKELKLDKKIVSKKKLHEAISEYLPNVGLQNVADVIRILGNDFTHYERKYSEYDLEVLKSYLKIFIERINHEYLVNHPPVYRKKQN